MERRCRKLGMERKTLRNKTSVLRCVNEERDEREADDGV